MMSKIVKTNDGFTFNLVTDGQKKWFVLECPECGEMLQMTDAMLDGTEPMYHDDKRHKSSLCCFGPAFKIGASLLSAMQVNMLFEGSPFTKENG